MLKSRLAGKLSDSLLLKRDFLDHHVRMTRLVLWVWVKHFLIGPNFEIQGLDESKLVTLSSPSRISEEWVEEKKDPPQLDISSYEALGWRIMGSPVGVAAEGQCRQSLSA